MKKRALEFTNLDAKPRVATVYCNWKSVPYIMAWYYAYHVLDRYTVTFDGEKLEKDENGELIG